MTRQIATGLCSLLLLATATAGYASGPDQQTEPLDLGTREEARVRLILVDAVVVDTAGRTVPDLVREDFEAVFRGRSATVDTLDVSCPIGAADDPRGVRAPARREPIGDAEQSRRIVLLLDYLHLYGLHREDVFDQMLDLVRSDALAGDEIMVAALTGGLRIEQAFTPEPDRVAETLRRMRHDVTLWNGNFEHRSEDGFVRGLSGLLEVLEQVPGRKSVVFFSDMKDVPLDSQFREIAAMATVSRCAFYPVDAAGLAAPGLDIVDGPPG